MSINKVTLTVAIFYVCCFVFGALLTSAVKRYQQTKPEVAGPLGEYSILLSSNLVVDHPIIIGHTNNYYADAGGTNDIAIGSNAVALGDCSIALGNNAKTTNSFELVIRFTDGTELRQSLSNRCVDLRGLFDTFGK
jgi:hypothetical protein